MICLSKKNVDADGGGDLQVVGIVSEEVTLADSPHQSVDAIDTMEQVSALCLHEAEIQDLHKAHSTCSCLRDGLAFPTVPHGVPVASFGVVSG